MRRLALAVGAAAVAAAAAYALIRLPGNPAQRPCAGCIDFALMGDQQYRRAQEAEFVRMMQVVDTASVAFVIHVGDIKSGGSPCSDSLFLARREQFGRSAHPFVLLFGDNDWTDCHRAGADPLERLAKLRQLFAAGDRSLGRTTIALERQSADPRFAAYRENVRWEHGGVLFAGLHVVGENNNRGRTAAMDAEYAARNAANLAWLRDAFRLARARALRGIVVAMQADPGFFREDLKPRQRSRLNGFDDLLAALAELAADFGKPVVLVHGDTHYFRIDKPLPAPRTGRRLPNFTRVEVFGDPSTHWVRGTIDPNDPAVFRFAPMKVPGNKEY